MGEMPRGQVPVVSTVLAEGGEHDAIWQGYRADFKGLENFRDRCVIWLRIGGCPCGRNLSWCEVGDTLSRLIRNAWFFGCLAIFCRKAVLSRHVAMIVDGISMGFRQLKIA